METLLTAVKPTGTPHLGNYAGAIRPAIEAIRGGAHRSVLFVADGHALNSITEPQRLARHTTEVAATYLACGLPEETVFFRQSDVPEIFELAALLACVCPKGLVNRAHAYKAEVARNEEAGREADAGINMGLFGYPILMAADILAFETTVVPVGVDQRQHVEIAREIARRMNRVFGEDTVVVPKLTVERDVGEVPGVDGRKMSKSYGNEISLVATPNELRKKIFSFVTDGRPVGEGAEPDEIPIYLLARAFCESGQRGELEAAIRAGVGFGAIKERVFEIITEHLAPIRQRFSEVHGAPDVVDQALASGAVRAREIASNTLARVKRAVGM